MDFFINIDTCALALNNLKKNNISIEINKEYATIAYDKIFNSEKNNK